MAQPTSWIQESVVLSANKLGDGESEASEVSPEDALVEYVL